MGDARHAAMTTLKEIQIVDACQPDGDGLIDFIVIDHPTAGIIRRCSYPGGAIVAAGTFAFSDLRIAVPPMGDELAGGLTVEIPFEDLDVAEWRSVPGEITVAWHQTTVANLGATDTFPTTWGWEGRVDSVGISRELITLDCVALLPLDEPAGRYFDLATFPALESFE
jgi:hypothetical protein